MSSRSKPTKDFLSKDMVDEFCANMLNFFDIPPYREVVMGEGEKTYTKLFANPLPTIYGFAKHTGFSSDKIRAWAEKYPEIKETMLRCEDMSKHIMITNSLMGLYQSTTSIFTQKNMFGWSDKSQADNLLPPTTITGGTFNISALLLKLDDMNNGKGLIESK